MVDLALQEKKKNKIVDFKCKRADSSGFSDEVISKLNLKFPQSYTDASIMAEISKALKTEEESQACLLPFCHTVEAEAFGGLINLSDGKFGPRTAAYAYQSVEELLSLPDFDFSKGRIGEVLKACQILKAQGEKVVLEVSGLLTILNSLIDTAKIFKAWRKDPLTVEKICQIIAENLKRYFAEAQKTGVNAISYADPAGSVNIVGPKYTEVIAKSFTYPLIKEAAVLAGEDCIIHLCPKTSLILLGLGLAEKNDLQFAKGINYVEACLSAVGQEKIIGQVCIKDSHCILCHGKIRALHLLP
ncbi:MAG: uroporphyrinogen decarboxylase family protein [Desulfotomaculaceae bacterium]|nr:uroporphyrinogen decarboxylase family protein [Desulfotomaculaceae bacterium]